ncbi:uncharacterized protein LOC119773724 [Cyprinodon tularosa]|uniref:uncharacterized protein LOC119773724 n=1 Tax=Cyprinodon tularosa TaxID=77115 RepID=UPI0018E267F8|nr:uncharacterized protein LOC119773724 [Cyprinodon tularosa]
MLSFIVKVKLDCQFCHFYWFVLHSFDLCCILRSTDLFPISYWSSEKIYLSDPLEVVDLYKVQRQRLLILHQHIEARVQKLRDIKQDVKEMKEKVSHLEENLSIQESDIKPMLEMEDRRANKFRRGVQRKETQKTETQDPIFTTVDRRVTEIYSCFFKEQPISTPLYTTREKLISVIEPIVALMKTLENIPEKELQQERGALIKARIREHKRQQEMEREKEKQRKCKRALTVRQKMPGRKLVERSRPLPKVEVKKEPSDVQYTPEGWLFHHILSK